MCMCVCVEDVFACIYAHRGVVRVYQKRCERDAGGVCACACVRIRAKAGCARVSEEVRERGEYEHLAPPKRD